MTGRREADNILALVASLAGIRDGFPVDQLEHSLQTASRAERADAPAEMVLVALCHDMGKPFSLTNHPAVAAEMLRLHLSDGAYQALAHHGEFVADLNHRTRHAARHEDRPWYRQARILAGWDHRSFDRDYPTLPFESFVPYVDLAVGG